MVAHLNLPYELAPRVLKTIQAHDGISNEVTMGAPKSYDMTFHILGEMSNYELAERLKGKLHKKIYE